MKLLVKLLGLTSLVFSQACLFNVTNIHVLCIAEASADSSTELTADEGWKNFYGIACQGGAIETITYPKQMGYDYTTLAPGAINRTRYANIPSRAGLKFYIIDPEKLQDLIPTITKLEIDTTRVTPNGTSASLYTQSQIDFFERYAVWKSMDTFPNNMATGWWSSETSFGVLWDFQQQAVIDYVVEQFISLVKSYEDTNLPFTFGGYMVDVPRLSGDFNIYDANKSNLNTGVTLSYWTGSDAGLVHGTITHEYATYTEGNAAFRKQLNTRIRQEWPDAKCIFEPDWLYSTSKLDEYIYSIKDRTDKDELTPDMLSQEYAGTEFIDDDNNFNSGVDITKGRVGSSQSGEVDEYKNRLFAAKAGINGAWYNWFGRFGGRGDMPDFQSITEVYPRLKLIRCLPNWDNLNNVPLSERSWDGMVYQSTKSYAGSDVMYSRHPKTGKLFAVFLTMSGAITLNAGETVTSVGRTDGFFVESGDGSVDVNITGNEIRLKSRKEIGKGYIFTVSSDGDQSMGTTGSEADGTTSSETSDGGINTGGVSCTTWYKYGEVGGASSSIAGEKRGKTNVLSATRTQATSTQAQWQQIPIRTQAQKTAGLAGGEGMQMIFDINYAPTNANIAYLVTDTSQVWKSTDGGTTWGMKHVGYRACGGSCIVVSPFNENVVFTAGGAMETDNLDAGEQGIYRTLDGGNTWAQVRSHWVKRQYSDNGGSLICFTGSNTIYAGTADEGLLRSTNAGTTWTTVATPAQLGASTLEVLDVAVAGTSTDGSYPKTLYVSTDNTTYKIRKVVDNDDGSPVITTIGAGLPTYPRAIAIAPTATSTFYATCGNSGVYKSTNSGANFSNINSSAMTTFLAGNSSNLAEYINVSPVDSNYVFVGFNHKKFYYSTNAGTTWNEPATTDEQNADGWVSGSVLGLSSAATFTYFRNPIATHPTNKNILLAIGDFNHIKKSTDGGANFRYSATGYSGGRAGADPSNTDQARIGWNSANKYAMFLGDAGVFLTEDGGSVFRNLKVPSYLGSNAAKAGTFDPTAGSNIIVTVNGNNSTQRIIITRNADASSPSWTALEGTDDNYRFAAFHPTNNNIVYIGKYRFDSIQTNNNYTVLTRTVNAVYKGNGDIIYSLASSGSNTRIYKSTDKGATWTNPYPDIPVSIGSVGQIVVDPNNPDKFYVAADYKGIYILNGTTWELKGASNGLVKDWLPDLYMQFVAVDPNDPNVLYAGQRPGSRWGHANGIFRSIDGGDTWTNVTGNLGPEITPWALTVNPYDSYIHLGSSHGSWKLPPPGAVVVTDTTWAFQQDASQQGIVSIEAEHYHANISQGGHDWVVAFNSGYSGESAISVTSNNGATVNTGYVTDSPRLDFQVEFVNTGTHYLWIRGLGETASDDSCHAGLDGAETDSSDRISGFESSWTWSEAHNGRTGSDFQHYLYWCAYGECMDA